MKRINRKQNGVVIRYLTEKMFKQIGKRLPVRIMVGGEVVEIRSKNQKELKKIASLKSQIKELQSKIN